MAGVSGITAAVRAALAAALTDAAVPCLAYDEWDMQSGSMAAVGAATWELADGADQAYGFRAITLPVMVYQLVDGSASQSLAYQETAFETIVNGLGADRTLGGKVVHCDVEGEASTAYYREPSGQTISVVTVQVRVMPFSNVGA